MDNSKLMKLVPLNYETNSVITSELLKKVLHVVTKLSSIKSFNNEMNILGDADYVPGTNIVDYLIEIFEMDKIVDDRFITLLHKAKISPDLVLNLKARKQLEDVSMSSNQYVIPKNDVIKITDNSYHSHKLTKSKIKSIKSNKEKLFAPKKNISKKFKSINWEEASDSE